MTGFANELGYAVARGWLTLTLADAAILARVKDDAAATMAARETRRSATVWSHIREQIKTRIRDVTWANARRHVPKNVILAEAHEINRGQTLSEREVNDIVLEVIWEHLPDPPRRRRHAG